MLSPFIRIVVDILSSNNKDIYWEIDNRFVFEGIPEFYVDVSRSTSEWKVLNTLPITGVNKYTDDVQRRFSTKFDFYYRVRCVDNGTEYISEVSPASGYFNKKEYLKAKNILRQIYLRSKKTSAGVDGYLLKRKEFGEKCTVCTDFSTGAVINNLCETCYGTRIVGGYYNTISEYYMDMSPIKIIQEDVEKPLASKDDRQRTAGVAYYPFLKTKDIFIEKHQNRRYSIEKITPVLELSGVPLYSMVDLSLLPITRIEYLLPI